MLRTLLNVSHPSILKQRKIDTRILYRETEFHAAGREE